MFFDVTALLKKIFQKGQEWFNNCDSQLSGCVCSLCRIVIKSALHGISLKIFRKLLGLLVGHVTHFVKQSVNYILK